MANNQLMGLPPHIQQLITQLLPPMEGPDPFAEMLGQLHQQVGQAQGAAQAGLGQLQALQAQPAPQTSPGTDALTELLGGLSQVLAPELGGLQQARGARAGIEENMQKRRAERLAQMEKHYDELAQRADQLGNTELSLQMRAKAESIKAKMGREEQRATLAGTLVRGEQADAAAMARTQVQEAGATDRTKLTTDAALNRVLARNPGLTTDANGNIVPLRGIDDASFNRALVPMAAAYSNANGSKKNDILPELKATFAQMKQSEALNPTVYISRLRTIGGNKRAGILGAILGEQKNRFTDVEIAHQTTLNYLDGDVTAPGNATKLMNMLQQAGYPPDRAHNIVKQYQLALGQ